MTHRKEISSFQEGIRRYQNALDGIADRIPVCAQLHEFAMKKSGATAREFYTNAKLLATATLQTHEKYGIEVPNLDYDVYNIEVEAVGQAMKQSESDMPDVDRTRPLIRNREDLDKIRTPDFVEGQDPDVEKLGPDFYKKYAVRHNLPLVLGIGAVFLATATPAKVAGRVKYYIEAGGKKRRLIFYLCNLGATTPPENVTAAVEAVHQSQLI